MTLYKSDRHNHFILGLAPKNHIGTLDKLLDLPWPQFLTIYKRRVDLMIYLWTYWVLITCGFLDKIDAHIYSTLCLDNHSVIVLCKNIVAINVIIYLEGFRLDNKSFFLTLWSFPSSNFSLDLAECAYVGFQLSEHLSPSKIPMTSLREGECFVFFLCFLSPCHIAWPMVIYVHIFISRINKRMSEGVNEWMNTHLWLLLMFTWTQGICR